MNEVGILIKTEADLKALGLSEEATKRLAAALKETAQAATQSSTVQQQAAQQTVKAAAGVAEAYRSAQAAAQVYAQRSTVGAAYREQTQAALAYGQAVQTQARQVAQATQSSTATIVAGVTAAGNAADGMLKGKLGGAAAFAASQLGGMGPVAAIASSAIIAMTTTAGPAGLAMAGLAASIGFLVYRVQQAKDRLAELAEVQQAAIAREQSGLAAENEIKRRLEVLRSEKPEIAEITVRYRELRNELEKGGARPQALAAADRARDLEIGALLKKQREEEAKATLQARDAIVSQIQSAREQRVALEEGAEAGILYSTANLTASEAVAKLGDEGVRLVRLLRDERLAVLAVTEAEQQRAAAAKFLAESGAALEIQKQTELEQLQKELALKQQIGSYELEKMRAAGAPEATILQRQIELLREQQRALENSAVERSPGQIAAIKQQADLAEIQLIKLQNTGIDVAGEIGRVVTDITSAVVAGTLKWADIGKSVLASFVRIGLETFSNFLRSMTQQSQYAQVAAAANIPVASSGGLGGVLPGSSGGGGFLSSLFGGGGGSGGGLFSGLNNFASSFLPSGTSLGGLATAGAGGFALSSLFGGSGLSNILSSVGSIGGTLLGASSFGAGISGAVTSALTGALGGQLAGMIGNYILPGIGSLLGILLGQLLQPKINPTVNVRSQLEGFKYDADINQFLAGSVRSTATGKDISQSTVNQTRNSVQQILEGLSKQWVDILNLFPVIVHDKMIPRLEATNALLNTYFGRLKFTEGGSLNIQQEIARLGERTGPEGFFHALRGTIGAGISATIQRAGLGDLSDLVNKSFAQVPEGSTFLDARNRLPGLKAPRNTKDVQPFFEAIGKFVGITSGLAGVSSSGVTPFLTETDLATVQKKLSDVLKVTEGKQFTQQVSKLETELKPVLDFLQQSMQESTSIFGRGLTAALEAATGGQAITAFNQALGQGVKDKLFSGITEAFVASAQFNDLLAPIQKTIREFTQEAINTGTAPDIDAFRRAILPGIEDIASRAETLAPLIAELQKLGVDVKDALRAFGLAGAGGTINITINGSVDSEERAADFARRVEELLRPALPPPT